MKNDLVNGLLTKVARYMDQYTFDANRAELVKHMEDFYDEATKVSKAPEATVSVVKSRKVVKNNTKKKKAKK
jgi:hypothetical protein